MAQARRLVKRHDGLFERVVDFEYLMACAKRAARGKRHRPDVLAFRFGLEREVLAIQRALQDGTWQPSGYREFVVREPKVRTISAAPFKDRVVHHALVSVLEPIYERIFISDSYASRKEKGTHLAVRRYQNWARASSHYLKMDVRKFFPSIDHKILLELLARRIADPRVLHLARRIVAGSNPQEHVDLWFPGDVPADEFRRRGLPIGNQTSQFFANVYMDPLDQFLKRRLGVGRYLRYVDDLALLGDSRAELRDLRREVERFAEGLRLRFNPNKCFIGPVGGGLTLLGYRVWPDRIRLPRKNVVRARRRLNRLARDVQRRRLPLDRASAALNAWIGHASHADSWRLREQMLAQVVFKLSARPGGEGRCADRLPRRVVEQ
ncbi:MAG: group II intron reverse transcriptase domain-containing protein [Actinobacteria bacterium]|nr:group II intron reverse transcriptase domain-containing protein [Actinomycetota bacterium]